MKSKSKPVVMQSKNDIEKKKSEIKEYIQTLRSLCTPVEKRILKSINT